MSRVVVAMSGGVDSSVAASLLRQQGYEVVGVFMRHGEHSPAAVCSAEPPPPTTALPVLPRREGWSHQPDAQARESGLDRSASVSSLPTGARPDSPRPHKQGCCSASDAQDARRVADRLDIPFYALNLQAEFGRIIDYFVDEYTRGRTPNPCVMCNTWLKFGRLFDYADSIGAEFVATGHYARMVPRPGSGDPQLHRGVDLSKDQSYALFGVQRPLLRRMLLPVGHYEKLQIRQLAGQLGLRVADKPDSQEICFVTTGQHDRFVREHRQAGLDTSGELVTVDGRVLGRHPGIESFTIGQRRGLGVALGERAFVVRIEPDTRRVVIGTREDLARRDLTADRTNWLVDPPPGVFRCQAKIRYNAQAAPATAEVLPDDRLRVQFDEPCYGVAAGQAVVCYDHDCVLGGGWIESADQEERPGRSPSGAIAPGRNPHGIAENGRKTQVGRSS